MRLNHKLTLVAMYNLEPVVVERIIPLRHQILRTGLPIETARFPEDDQENARHFAAVLQDQKRFGEVICCASFMLNCWEGEPAWQLRGMATTSEFQGCGIGTGLLAHAEKDIVSTSPVRLFWCNARVPAVKFYQKCGWTIASDEFDIPTVGPHCKMFKRVI